MEEARINIGARKEDSDKEQADDRIRAAESKSLFTNQNFRRRNREIPPQDEKEAASSVHISEGETEAADEFHHLKRIRERETSGDEAVDHHEEGMQERFASDVNHSDMLSQDAALRFVSKEKRERANVLQRLEPLFKILITIVGAVILGMLFGWFVLTTFVNQNWDEAGQPTKQPPEGSEALVQNEGVAGQGTVAAEPGTLVFPSWSLQFVQAGAFSNENGASASLASVHKSGLPAAVFPADAYYVMTAVSPKREHVVDIKSLFSNRDMPTYLKEWQFDAFETSLSKAVPEADGYGETLQQLVNVIGTVSAAGMDGDKVRVENWEKVRQMHRSLLSRGRSVTPVLPEDKRDSHEKMLEALTQSFKAVSQYREQASTAYLRQAQQSLLDFMILYREFSASAT